MSDLEQKVDAIVRPFVAQLAKLLAAHATEAFQQALGGGGAKAARPAAAAAPAAPRAEKKKKAGRPAKAVDGSLADRVKAHLTANTGGQRMDQLSKALGTPVPKLQSVVAKLMSGGALRREGERRGVRYYLASS